MTTVLEAPPVREPAAQRSSGAATAALFTCTSFTGAALLFLVQPMVAKLLLPLFGGSPAVWNTSNLFFQTTLLAGYLLTHLTVRRLGVRRQSLFQLGVAALPLALLPIGLPESTGRPGGLTTVLWLLVVLAVSVGAPFLVLSTVGPLLQRWFGALPHPRAADPYFLFAAGNTGSLLALLSYPALVEPRLTLAAQLRLWSWGYVAFLVLLAVCALVLRRTVVTTPVTGWQAEGATLPVAAERPPLRRRLRWVALAALPSSLMLGATTHLSTDLTPLPLLWVVPLALYLITFIVAFALSREGSDRLSRRLGLLLPALAVPVVLGATGTELPLVAQVITHLALFTVVAQVAHARLAADRPGVAGLTGFYLHVAVGGALGGAVNALVAPVLFDHRYEYGLAIALALLLVPAFGGRQSWFERRYGVLGTVLLLCVGMAALPALELLHVDALAQAGWALAGTAVILMVLLGAVGVRSPKAFALGLALILVLPLLLAPDLLTTRTFFGVQQVSAQDGQHVLRHGSTIHGVQDMRPGRAGDPRSYYHRDGPLGQVFADQSTRLRDGQIGVVGLGTGTVAAYGEPGQTMTFFEIDPATAAIARDPELFTYLTDSRAEVSVVLGDGRLSLLDQPAGRFDLLVLDAFSSDAIPVHLLTRQAVELYLSRLAEDGVLVVHISNRYLDLGPVLADLAGDLQLSGVIQSDRVNDPEVGKTSSTWVALSRDDDALAELARDERWQPLSSLRQGERVWTDDYSNVLGALI